MPQPDMTNDQKIKDEIDKALQGVLNALEQLNIARAALVSAKNIRPGGGAEDTHG